MPASHSYAAAAAPLAPPEYGDDLLQPLRRIDRAHQLLADIDDSSVNHLETNESAVLGPSSALVKESPMVSHTAKLSPPLGSPPIPSPDPFASAKVAEGMEECLLLDELFQWQAADLVAYLQQWSDDLDQRSAKLHADIAAQERRERTFRLWMQQQRAELEAQASAEANRLATRSAEARRAFFAATDTGL